MSDCKHMVGLEEECDGQSPVYFGDEVMSLRWVEFYAFCPLCGEELSGELATEYTPSQCHAESLPTPEVITREALRILQGHITFADGPRRLIIPQCGVNVIIRKPV